MRFLLASLALSLFANSAFAQAPDTGAKATAARTFVIDGPAPSPTPNVMTRDTSNGKSTVRAIKLKAPLKFDGDTVAKGDVVGLIEVMKSFTEVKADAAGKIKFVVDNEEPVMAGQPLAEIG